MEYTGKLYGRLGDMYFDTGKTSEDWDLLINAARKQTKIIKLLIDGARIDNIDEARKLITDADNILIGLGK